MTFEPTTTVCDLFGTVLHCTLVKSTFPLFQAHSVIQVASYLFTCQLRVTADDSGLRGCVACYLSDIYQTPLIPFIDFKQ